MSRRDPQGLGFDPPTLRTLITCYSRYIELINVWRKEEGEQMSAGELLGLASVLDECHQKRSSLQRRLDRVECQRHSSARRAAFQETARFSELMGACEGQS